MVLIIYVVMSGLTLLAFAWDKYAARHGRWRVRESTLHVLELLGGFPGALAAQQIFRHKSFKQRYQLTLLAIALAHVAAWTTWLWGRA